MTWATRSPTPPIALRLLDAWGSMLDECYDTPERSMHPVFVALHETIRECDLPRQLFSDLLHAFRMDQVKPEYDTWDELLEYSHYSANPVGRLVLWVCGYREEESLACSPTRSAPRSNWRTSGRTSSKTQNVAAAIFPPIMMRSASKKAKF